MNKNHLLSYFSIGIGAIISLYAKAEASQNSLILIVGLVFLMYGTYRLTKTISNSANTHENSFREEEE